MYMYVSIHPPVPRWLAVKEDRKHIKGSEWSDRKEEGKWKEEARRKTGQCQFVKLLFFTTKSCFSYPIALSWTKPHTFVYFCMSCQLSKCSVFRCVRFQVFGYVTYNWQIHKTLVVCGDKVFQLLSKAYIKLCSCWDKFCRLIGSSN